MSDTPKDKGARQAIGRESIGFAFAEVASMVASLGVVGVFDALIPKSIMHAVNGTVAKICVEPFLDPIEKVRNKLCSLEECKVDKSQPRQQRAEAIAKWLVVGGASLWASYYAKLWVRDKANNHFKVPGMTLNELPVGANVWDKLLFHLTFRKYPRDARMILFADEAAHMGALLFLNTKGAKFTDNHIRSTQAMLEKCGISKEKAHEMATWVWVWEAPNLAGMAAGISAISGKHAYGWPKGHTHQSFVDIVKGKASSLAEHLK